MKPKIEDIEIDDMELLLSELKFKPDNQRNAIIRKYAGGYCVRCCNIPTKKVSYKIQDAVLVERYCDKCFQYMKEGRGKEILTQFVDKV